MFQIFLSCALFVLLMGCTERKPQAQVHSKPKIQVSAATYARIKEADALYATLLSTCQGPDDLNICGLYTTRSASADRINFNGIVVYKQGKLDKAMMEFDGALEMFPLHANAWNNKGVIFVHQDKIEEASLCFDEALKFDKINRAARENKAMIQAHTHTSPKLAVRDYVDLKVNP